jgi:serine/threonine-protein kinase RsbW
MSFAAKLEMRSELGELTRLERFLADMAQRVGLDERTVYLLNLACDELVTNIMMHGYDSESTGSCPITLDVKYADGKLVLRLADEGRAFDPLSRPAPDVTLDVEERGIGGLGIHFVRQVMDDVSYERVGERNVLTMRKRWIDGITEAEESKR